MLRVIAGKYRSRLLEQPPLDITRPTTDKTKEAIFSSIQNRLENSIVLDLFAGSGSLSIESVSRGATKAFAVDKNSQAIEVINYNIANLKIPNIDVIKMDVLSFLKSAVGKKFDLIFIDPPFKDIELTNKIIQIIEEQKILKNLGLIILETKVDSLLSMPDGLVVQKLKRYGASNIYWIANNI